MFSNAYKKRMDAIRPDPSFRSSVQQIVMERKDRMNHRFNFTYRRKMIIAVAMIALMLAATAFAVVQGNLLRKSVEAAGGAEFANQVQDVHISSGGDFSFTVDEILWEGDKMYLSYSVSVPDDGNTYLYALCYPRLNGEKLSCGYAHFYDEAGMPLVHAVGGELGAVRSGVIRDIIVEPASQQSGLLDMQAMFFKSNYPVQYIGQWEDYNAMMEAHAVSKDEVVRLLPDTDTLYYFGEDSGAEWAAIYLEFHPDYWKNWREKKQDKMHMEVLAPEEFAATGIAELMDNVSLNIPVELSMGAHSEYNDVAQRIYEMDGFTLEITDFSMNHLGASYKAEIRTEGEIAQEYAGNEPYAQFYALILPDGTELNNGQGSSFGSGGLYIKPDGRKVYLIDQTINAVIPLEEIDELLLAPQLFKEDGEFEGYDHENAIRIQPVYNPDKHESTPVPTEDPVMTDDLSS